MRLEDTKCPQCGAAFESLLVEGNANPMLDTIRCPCGWGSNLTVFKVGQGVPSDFDPHLSRIFLAPMMPSERLLEDLCPKCGQSLVAVQAPAWGRWGGWVKCKSCDYKVTACKHVVEKTFIVERLPDGTKEL